MDAIPLLSDEMVIEQESNDEYEIDNILKNLDLEFFLEMLY